ncbi:MAG: peroxiredoxin [Pirellula sp.]
MWHLTQLFAVTSIWGASLFVGVAVADPPQCLQVGDAIPEFQCLDDQGKMLDSRQYVGKQMLVIYFYPSDFAFCCTRQAQRYRDCQDELDCRGVKLIGISGDTVEAHEKFKSAYLLNFPLLADVDGKIATSFGVPLRSGGKAVLKDSKGKEVVGDDGKSVAIQRCVTAARWTIIIGKDGRILSRQSAVTPINDSKEVLDFIEKMDSKSL